MFELLEEIVAWECRNDLPARFVSATLHVDKSLKMAAKLGDCRKLECTEICRDREMFISRILWSDLVETSWRNPASRHRDNVDVYDK